MGASIALVAGGAHEAKAQIAYSGTQNVLIPSNDISGIYFDFDTNTFSPVATGGSDANLFDAYVVPDITGSTAYHSVSFYGPMRPGVTLNSALATLNTTNGETLKLSAGAVIGPNPATGVFGHQNDLANQFYSYPSGAKVGSPTGQWIGNGTSVQTGYIGFRFVNATGQTDYGWFHISFNPVAFMSDQPSATVIDWAYNTSGGSILAGQVPEPGSMALALLGAGAAGLVYWRRRRAEAASPQA